MMHKIEFFWGLLFLIGMSVRATQGIAGIPPAADRYAGNALGGSEEVVRHKHRQ